MTEKAAAWRRYREDREAAVPSKAGCYSCDDTWAGASSRGDANLHHAATGHPIWVECVPPDPGYCY